MPAAGWAWSPAVEPAIVRAVLGLEKDERALLSPDGGWELISAGDWTQATRSAVRLTATV